MIKLFTQQKLVAFSGGLAAAAFAYTTLEVWHHLTCKCSSSTSSSARCGSMLRQW